VTCPKCGLGYYRPDRDNMWMCYACGFMPYGHGAKLAAFFVVIALVVCAVLHWCGI
jgi:ribosomal protein L37AE/L43A